MAKRKFSIQIPEPCPQDRNAMPIQGEGRFCAVCQKCVIDFTTKTDREIIEIVRRSQEKICGTFRADQLNRNMLLPHQARISGWRLFALTFGSLFATGFAHAQTNHPKQPAPKHYTSARPVKPKGKFLVISGTVKTKEGKPLAEAFVGIKGKPGILAFTDSLGRFRFKLPESQLLKAKNKRLVLTFSRVGYKVAEKTVAASKNYMFPVTLQALPAAPPKEVAVAEITYEVPLIGPEKVSERLVQGEILLKPTREITYPKDSYYQLKHKL